MIYIIKEYKIPKGSETSIDEVVAIAVENYIAKELSGVPVEETIAYKEAVDDFRVENQMERKFEIVKPLDEVILDLKDVDENTI